MDRPRRPITSRAAAPGTRRAPIESEPPKKNNLPIILGAAGGGLMLLILIVALASSGGSKPDPVWKPPAPKPAAAAPAPPRPDVSQLEAKGKKLCDEGMTFVKLGLTPAAGASRDRIAADLEKGLKLLNDGLEAYREAAQKAGKTYPLDEIERTREKGIAAYCDEIEKTGVRSCDRGLALIQSSEKLMSGTLTVESRVKLRMDLEEGKKLIEEGMNLLDKSYQVSNHKFDTNKYGQALKLARSKLLELK
jgi:hypothetical protein